MKFLVKKTFLSIQKNDKSNGFVKTSNTINLILFSYAKIIDISLLFLANIVKAIAGSVLII